MNDVGSLCLAAVKRCNLEVGEVPARRLITFSVYDNVSAVINNFRADVAYGVLVGGTPDGPCVYSNGTLDFSLSGKSEDERDILSGLSQKCDGTFIDKVRDLADEVENHVDREFDFEFFLKQRRGGRNVFVSYVDSPDIEDVRAEEGDDGNLYGNFRERVKDAIEAGLVKMSINGVRVAVLSGVSCGALSGAYRTRLRRDYMNIAKEVVEENGLYFDEVKSPY